MPQRLAQQCLRWVLLSYSVTRQVGLRRALVAPHRCPAEYHEAAVRWAYGMKKLCGARDKSTSEYLYLGQDEAGLHTFVCLVAWY